ncbi:MAG: 5-oxoprolinase subunit PxpB [Castellaniella sp.]
MSGTDILRVPPWHCEQGGDRCLVVVFEAHDPECSNRFAVELARRIVAAGMPQVRDVVPSMAAVGVHFEPASARDAVVRRVQALMPARLAREETDVREIELPVCYGGEHGRDLDDVARHCGLDRDEVIALHSASRVRVLMLGFAPGHPYLGMFDARLSIGRRTTPRTAVPQGSIGLANRQCVIYPVVLPAGWNLIGRIPLRLFDPLRASPCLLDVGDYVRFRAIGPEEFEHIAREQGPAIRPAATPAG